MNNETIESKEKFEIYEDNKEIFSVILDDNIKIYTYEHMMDGPDTELYYITLIGLYFNIAVC